MQVDQRSPSSRQEDPYRSLPEGDATLLRPTGMETLATNLWSATTGGAYAKAAAPALLLILASTLPTLLLEQREIRNGNPNEG